MTTLNEGYHWVNHPTNGVTIIRVKHGQVYEMGSVPVNKADDPALNKLARVQAKPHNFEYRDARGWF